MAVFVTTPIVVASTGLEPALIISDYVVEPAILMPGDRGTITVTITNTAIPSIPATSKTISSEESSFFNEFVEISGGVTTETSTGMETTAEIQSISLVGREIKSVKDPTGKIKLGPAQSLKATFAIEAGSNTNDGIYFPKVIIEIKDDSNVEYSIPVSVDGSSLSMIATNIPSSIPIGRVTEIEIGIVNMRPNDVKGVGITPKADGMEFNPKQIFVDTTSRTSESPSSFDPATSLLYGNIPSSSITSTSSSSSAVSALTSTMVPYQVSNVKFNINPTSVGNKEIVFELEYKNGNNIHIEELPVSLNIIDVTDVKLVPMDEPGQVIKGSTATIDFEVVNARPTKIVSVSVIPIASESVKPNERFIGTMEADDVFNVKFDIETKDLKVGESDFGFKVIFRGEGSDKTYESGVYKVPITVIEPQSDEKLSLSVVTLAFLPFIGGYYVYMQRERRKT